MSIPFNNRLVSEKQIGPAKPCCLPPEYAPHGAVSRASKGYGGGNPGGGEARGGNGDVGDGGGLHGCEG